MKKANKIVVEAIIPCAVETLWARSQEPDAHVLWDIRFSGIKYLDGRDENGFNLMDYRTRIGFGVEVKGVGKYLQNAPLKSSTFEFSSADWKSLIVVGRGIWLYKPCAEGAYFRTVYDYETRYGFFGKLIDALLFRPVMQLATEWSFETLRRWCAGDESALESRASRLKFALFFVKRFLGFAARAGEAESWIGSGKETNLNPTYQTDLRRAT